MNAGLRPYSLDKARAIFRSHWGTANFEEAKTGLALFTQSNRPGRSKPTSYMFSNIRREDKPYLGDAPVFEAAAAAMAMPVAFQPNRIGDIPMYDGAFLRAFPLKQAFRLAEDLRDNTNRPIVILGITAGFNQKVSKLTKFIQGRTPREQIDRQTEYLHRKIAKGEIDAASCVIDVPIKDVVPKVSQSFTNVSDKNIARMIDAADLTIPRIQPHLDRLRSRLGLSAEL